MKRLSIAIVALATALALTGCAAGEQTNGSGSSASSDPVSGGVLRVVETAQPTSLDPAVLHNVGPRMPVIGNSLYGQLMTDDPVTGEAIMVMLEEFSSDDGGNTFTVKVRDGIEFSDGTPFNAEAVKFGWERIKDPATGSSVIGTAIMIDSIEIIDDLTLQLQMASPSPQFPGAVLFTQMNWIGSPQALQEGPEAFNENPIGAGPFVLESWFQGDTVNLTRNENYYVEGLPLLDGIEVRGIVDPSSAYNALLGGQADVLASSSQEQAALAEASDLSVTSQLLSGGSGIVFNTSKAPFDDLRARQAISYAIDRELLNESTYAGFGTVPETLFKEGTPFFTDVPLGVHDPEQAQELFDELAKEGSPLEFTMAVFPGSSMALFEGLQAQLSQYDNVSLTADQRDQSEVATLPNQGDFQLISGGVIFNEPDPRLWIFFSGESGTSNFSRVNDSELNDALNAGRDGSTTEERAAAYEEVAQRLLELQPTVFINVNHFGSIQSPKVHDIHLYGMGSLVTDGIWLEP